MLTVLAYIWMFVLAVFLIAAVIAMFVLGGQMVREDKEREAMMQAERPKEIVFEGPSRHELNMTTARLLRADRKRPTRRMEWRIPNV